MHILLGRIFLLIRVFAKPRVFANSRLISTFLVLLDRAAFWSCSRCISFRSWEKLLFHDPVFQTEFILSRKCPSHIVLKFKDFQSHIYIFFKSVFLLPCVHLFFQLSVSYVFSINELLTRSRLVFTNCMYFLSAQPNTLWTHCLSDYQRGQWLTKGVMDNV